MSKQKTIFGLDGKVAIVTGGSRGIGAAISHRLAEMGSDVITVHSSPRSPLLLQRAIRRLGRRTFDLPNTDVCQEQHVKNAVTKALERFGHIDILANNAGIYVHSIPEDTTIEEWDSVLNVNLRGAFLFAREVGKHMITSGRGGRIVNIASISALQPEPDFPHYVASKAGIIGLTRTLALSWGRYKINVNAVAPGLVDTGDIWRSATSRASAFKRASPLSMIPRAEDIANAVAFLCSDASSMITGATIVVDAGASLSGYMSLTEERNRGL